MSYPISTAEALAILPKVDVSTTDNSVGNTSLTDLINSKTQQVIQVLYPQRYRRTTFILTDHQKDIINLCAQLKIWQEVLGRRLANVTPSDYTYFNKFIALVDAYFTKALRCGYFYASVKTNKLPQVQLATDVECASLVTSFATPSSATIPSNTTIDIWAKQFSSVVYSYAKPLGNFVTPSNINTIPSNVLTYYQDCVEMLTGSLIAIVHSTQYSDSKGQYEVAKNLWEDGHKLIEDLRLNKVLFTPNIT